MYKLRLFDEHNDAYKYWLKFLDAIAGSSARDVEEKVLKMYDAEYVFDPYKYDDCILFKDEETAMLFKLTWS